MSGEVVSRRTLLKALGAAAGAVILGACAPREVIKEVPVEKEVIKEVPVEKEVIKEVPVGPVPVSMYMNVNMFLEADSFVEGQAWTVHLPEFNRAQDEVLLRAEPVSAAEFNPKVPMMTEAKELGNALLWTERIVLGDWVRQNMLIPLDDLAKQAGVDLEAIYDERALTLCRFDPATNTPRQGPLWSLPMALMPGINIIGYNGTMFEEAGLNERPTEDWTYDDILAAAKKITKPGKWGFVMNVYGGAHGLGWDYAYIAPFGGYIIDREGKKALVNTPGSMEGWEFYYDLLYTHKVAPTRDDITAMGGYKEGHMASKLAMYRNGPWGGMHFILIPEEGKPGHIEAGMIPAPKGKSGRPGQQLAVDRYGISSNATDPMACFKALLWMTNTDAGSYRAKGALIAGATKEFFAKPEMLEHPYISITIKSLADSEMPYVPANGRTKEVNDLLGHELTLIDVGKERPTQAFFDALNDKLQAILDMPGL
jgi:multiple sugar transport system substrate-binding protein